MISRTITEGNQDSGTPTSVVDLLARLERLARSGEDMSLDSVMTIAGHRFTGPLLLIPGLIIFSPMSGIPLLPTFLGVTVSLICVQMILGRRHLWFPAGIQSASLDAHRVLRLVRFLKKPAHYLDRATGQRLTWMTHGLATRFSAAICLLAALSMPFLEIIPFASTLAGAVIALFGLSLTTRDGLLMLFALVFFGGLTALGGNLLLAD